MRMTPAAVRLALVAGACALLPATSYVQRPPALHHHRWRSTFAPSVSPLFSASSSSSSTEVDEPPLSPRRAAYGALWAGLLGYATYFTQTVNVDEEVAAKVLNTVIFTPFDGTLSPIFVTIFFFLGVLPSVYASLLLPTSKRQRVWALPFVGGSFALGFFGIGPYLGLRNKPPAAVALPWTREDADIGSGALEFKGTPLFLLASSVYLAYFALNGQYEGDRWQGFMELFNSQPLARISTIDFTILCMCMWDPLEEDMRRRRFTGPDAKVFCALPIFGPLVYLLLRPSVQEQEAG